MNHDASFSLPMMHSAWLEPDYLSSPAPWAGHIPFAAWLMAIMRPRTLVELGVYSGISYLTFCQAASIHQIPLRMWGVDTWQGDAHAGSYDGVQILQTLRKHHDARYSHFSTLLQKTFDEALTDIADGSVDVLHIDGLHTYDAVRHDFETWQPKLSERAVVLFHDTTVHQGDFGVWRYWEELTQRFPSLSFTHSNGLGVLLVGVQAPDILRELAQDPMRWAQVQLYFRILGTRFELGAESLHLNTVISDLQRNAQKQQIRIETQNSQLTEKEKELHQLSQKWRAEHAQVRHLQDEMHRILHSRSWRLTAGLRFLADGIRYIRATSTGQTICTLLRRVRKALGYIVTGNWHELMQRIHHIRKQKTYTQRFHQLRDKNSIQFGILATPHTWFVAHAIASALTRAGLSVQIVEESQNYPLDIYFVICPQMFKHLPPGNKRIVFQMEQSVSTRWFTPEYLTTLENSLAVLDYAHTNMRQLAKYGIVFPQVFFAPIGAIADYAYTEPHDAEYDVLFYGDVNAPRRKRMLDVIAQHFKLRIVGNAFGDEMQKMLASAKVVVNLHYYEGALLETTRIYECLSLGKSIVSEISADQDEHKELEGVVRFVPLDDEQALLAALQEAIAEQNGAEGRAAYAQRCQAVVASSQVRFEFMIYRLLLAQRIIDYPTFANLTQPKQILAPRIALSLPETTQRREAFMAIRPTDMHIFDGVRYTPGWLGAAMSFKYLAQLALQQNLPFLEIMEDDVELPPDYQTRRTRVDSYLAMHSGEWDAFVGVMALVHPDTRVLKVERIEGETYVTIDRMISMVGNIYAPSALQRIAQWDEHIEDANINTIDRFLQLQGDMRVVVTLPFLLGHSEELDSSLWGFSNTRYIELIAQAQSRLEELVINFEKNNV